MPGSGGGTEYEAQAFPLRMLQEPDQPVLVLQGKSFGVTVKAEHGAESGPGGLCKGVNSIRKVGSENAKGLRRRM